MNKKQADNVLNLIDTNISAKYEQILNILIPNDKLGFNEIKTHSAENEFSLLGKLYSSVSTMVSLDQKIDNFLQEKNITEDNIKEIATKNFSKVKSIKDFKEKIRKCFSNPKYYFDGFVYKAYLLIDKQQQQTVDACPKAVVDRLNQIRELEGLGKVVEFDSNKRILSSNLIDKKISFNPESINQTSVDELEKVVNSLGYKVRYQNIISPEFDIVNDKKIISLPSEHLISSEKNEYDILNNLNEVAQIFKHDYASNENQLSTFLYQNKTKNESVDFAHRLFEKFNLPRQNSIQESFSNIVALLLTIKTASLVVSDKQSYIQIAKTIRYDVNNQLNNLVDNFNCDGAIYAMVEVLKDSFDKVVTKLNLNSAQMELSLQNKGVEIVRKDKISELLDYCFCEQKEQFNNNNLAVSEKVNVNFKSLKSAELYNYLSNIYKKGFVKIYEKKEFVPNEGFDKNAQIEKIDGITKKILKVLNVVESRKTATPEQVQILFDGYAYANVALNEIKQLSSEAFNYDIDTDSLQKSIEPQKEEKPTQVIEPEVIEPNFDYLETQLDTSKTGSYAGFVHNDIVENEVNERIYQEEETTENDIQQTQETIEETEEAIQQTEEVVEETIEAEDIIVETVETNEQPIVEQRQTEKEREIRNEQLTEKKLQEIEQKFASLQQSYKALEEKLESASTREKELLKKEMDAQKLELIEQKLNTVLSSLMVKSVNSLANRKVDELSTILYKDKIGSESCTLLVSSLNMLFRMDENDRTVRNMFIAMNKPQTAKELMLLKSNIQNIFVNKLALKLAPKALEVAKDGMTDIELINKTLIELKDKYTATLEDSRLTAIDMLGFEYDSDSFEYQDAVDEINEKYYGTEESVGLFEQLNKNLISTLLKDVILDEIKQIYSCDKNNKKYVFDERKIDRVIDDIFIKEQGDEEQHTF